ncbi:DHA2 family efflux MFS transporter permease subunit [Nocardia paucivorans]|uniref:DHA2 family efflux MFS transporter permease subunit n=1 Tax=Nocardia paucivorans TaxID=114259 RepID=UPI00030B7D4D|nr:DHA2 family efflux MFS transporter permease subunit [Nocardia paucivorans]
MPTRNPWPALVALVVGFFMILLDMTIVAVANPAIMTSLHTDIPQVVWVTSAYLLAYAVPLPITGRLGDRFGPKNIYLLGLGVFTAASLWCGLSGTIGMLIAARAVQGLGAALMTPQTMAVITRTFPPDRRGAAMGVWGGVAGLATLIGPLLGGFLVDGLGWEWIFIVNVPVGIVAFALAAWLVPALPTQAHKFDIPGVVLSALGMFGLVFGIQEGNSYDWSARIWLLIGAGLLVLAVFVFYQARGVGEPLVPLGLFRDRNFALANLAIAAMGAATSASMVPAYFYLQSVREMSSTVSALVLAPMAIVTAISAPLIGRFVGRLHPRVAPTSGFALFALSVAWFALLMSDPNSSIALFLVNSVLAGLANACIWGPLAATATHNLPLQQAGAGAGIYNTTRQVGTVLGSAGISALIAARMSASGLAEAPAGEGMSTGPIPEPVKQAFSSALGGATYLPALILLIGTVASALFIRNTLFRSASSVEPKEEVEPKEMESVEVA